MNKTLLLLFNHTLTPDQEVDAWRALGISKIVEPPSSVSRLWANVPPDIAEVNTYLNPVKQWLASQGCPGDYVLIQGDFGATCLMVQAALNLEFIPVYATTQRSVEEEAQPDGMVKITHRFRHVRFRKYGG